jgi:predicted metal-dependent HD superfamily phosphohydrolase
VKDRLAARLSELGRAGDARKTAAELVARYTEPHRAYHNLAHIADCLEKLDLARPMLRKDEEDAVELALWWHDAVYDARAADNEERSAALFREAAASHRLAAPLAGKVERLILLTKTHAPGADAAEQAMIDVDLSILGAPPSRFAAYDAAIRREYAHVPEDIWRERRARVLAGFLARPRLFATALFHERFDAEARANLSRALAQLGRSTAPSK